MDNLTSINIYFDTEKESKQIASFILQNISIFLRSGIIFKMEILEEKNMTKDVVRNLRNKGINTVPAMLFDRDVFTELQIIPYLKDIIKNTITQQQEQCNNNDTYDHEIFMEEQRNVLKKELFSGKGSINEGPDENDQDDIEARKNKYIDDRKKA